MVRSLRPSALVWENWYTKHVCLTYHLCEACTEKGRKINKNTIGDGLYIGCVEMSTDDALYIDCGCTPQTLYKISAMSFLTELNGFLTSLSLNYFKPPPFSKSPHSTPLQIFILMEILKN